MRVAFIDTAVVEIACAMIARTLGESALGATNSVSSTTTSLSTVGSATPIVPAASSRVK